MGCPIRISTDQRLLAAPRGLSQRATSFIASWCQGIHRMPFSRSRSLSPGDHRLKAGDKPGDVPPCTETILSGWCPNTRTTLSLSIPGPSPRTRTTLASEHRAAAGCRDIRSDLRRPRPETHQNLIHPDKDPSSGLTRGPAPPCGDTSGVAVPHRNQQSRFAFASPRRRPTGSITEVVEVIGLEPTTPCLQSRCSPS